AAALAERRVVPERAEARYREAVGLVARVGDEDGAPGQGRRAVVAVLDLLRRQHGAVRLVDRVERPARPGAADVPDARARGGRRREGVLAGKLPGPDERARVAREGLQQAVEVDDEDSS